MSLTKKEKAELIELISKYKIKSQEGWHNFANNLNYQDALVLDIEDKEALSAVVAKINELNQKKEAGQRILVRAAAGRRREEYAESFSFTPEVDADVIIRLTGKSFRKIKGTFDPNVMEIGASVQIGEADRILYDQFKLSLPTSSLIPYVTIAGLSANAGHGTGRDQPSFSGLIRAMTICLPNGEIVRLDKSHPDFEEIRGAHLGLFGIVLSVELECTPAKKMHCIMDVSTVPDFLSKVKAGLYDKYPYVSVMYVPTYQSDEMNSEKYSNVIIYSWEPVDIDTPDMNSCQELSHLGQRIQIKLEKGLNITDLMRSHPHLIPYFTRYLVSSVAIGKEDRESIGPWYTMHYQTAFPRDIDDADYLFQVSSHYDEIATAFTKVVSTLTKYAKNEQYPILDAVYLRLFKGTNGGLSTSAHQGKNFVCGLDMVSSNGIPGYTQFKDEMAEYFINGPLQSKPHWGKYVPENVDYAKLYGDDFNRFIDVLKRWYKDNKISLEHSMLLNQFHNGILNLPYQPVKRLEAANKQFVKKDTYQNLPETAHALFEQLDSETKAGKKLAQRLQVIENPSAMPKDHVFFNTPNVVKKVPTQEPEAKHDGCCVLF